MEDSPYDRQGEGQPFGYTGYRYDDISGTYFAQAREYQPRSGRFTAEDVVKGNGAVPQTLNRYGYCWGNPVGLVDLDGKEPNEIDTCGWPTYEEVLEYSDYELENLFEGFDEQESKDFFMEMMRQAQSPSIVLGKYDPLQVPSKKKGVYYNTEIGPAQPSEQFREATPNSYDCEIKDQIFEVHIQYGTGLYGKVNYDGLGVEVDNMK